MITVGEKNKSFLILIITQNDLCNLLYFDTLQCDIWPFSGFQTNINK